MSGYRHLRLSPRLRGLLLGFGLLLTLLAVYQVDAASGEATAEVSAPAAEPGRTQVAALSPASPGSPALSGSNSIHTDRLEQPREMPAAAGDPFGQAAWTPARIAAAEAEARAKREAMQPPPPPPPPMAPALPFKFFGRMVDGEVRKVFLDQGSRTLVVAAGETIDDLYRVDRIDEQAVHFTYLPLGQQQMLAIPGTP
jgi:hypothetical protein